MKQTRSVEDLLVLLQEGVSRLVESERYQKYLKVMSRFPSYSIRNTILIFEQMPEATFVAGYQKWKHDFKRQVRKGEKGIRIFAPCTIQKKIDDNGIERTEKKLSFRAISVFDISQTDGEPLPDQILPETLSGDCPLLESGIEALEEASGFKISFLPQTDGIRGRCRYEQRSIEIDENLEQMHQFKTAIHESAHALLHQSLREDVPFEKLLTERQELREIEAESVSFAVCCALGIDCSEYSFPYIAHWKKKEQFLSQSLERISAASKFLLEAIRKKAGCNLQTCNQ